MTTPNASLEVPADFPRETYAAVSGVQAKLAARLINGQFVTGMTPEELYERWDICEDLAQQLATRTRRHQAEGRADDLDAHFKDTERRVRHQPWELSSEEIDWVMKRTRELVS